MAQLTVFINQKPLILTDEEDTYYMPPAEHYKSYIYCKAKNDADALRIINICEKDEKLEIAMLFNSSIDELKKMVWAHFTIIEAAGGIVLNEKDEVLLIERKSWWDLPKGKMDAGETHEQTAIREVKEETGLHSITIAKSHENTYHTYNVEEERFLKICYWYEMKGSSAEKLIPQTEEQITQIIWVAKTDLKNYFATTYPAIVALLKSY